MYICYITAISMTIIAVHAQRFALCIYAILKLYFVVNKGSCNVKLQVTIVARFTVTRCRRGAITVTSASQRINPALTMEWKSTHTEGQEL